MRTLIGVFTLSVVMTTAGTVTRQFFHLNDGPIIGWRCPSCGSGNAGEPQFHFAAVCQRCSLSMPWEEAAVVSEREIDDATESVAVP